MLNHPTPADGAGQSPQSRTAQPGTRPLAAAAAVERTPDHPPAYPATGEATVITAVLSTPALTVTAPGPDTELTRLHRTNAALMAALTATCFAFLAYLLTIDKTDLQTGVPATLAVVLSLNAAVFGTRTWIHRTRRAAAAAGYAVAAALDPGPGPDAGGPQ